MQAEAKIGNMTDAQNEKLEKIFENVKKQMTLAISSEVKNKKLKKRDNKRKAPNATPAESKGSEKQNGEGNGKPSTTRRRRKGPQE